MGLSGKPANAKPAAVKAAPTRGANTRAEQKKREKAKQIGKIDKSDQPHAEIETHSESPSQNSEANKTPKTVSILQQYHCIKYMQ